MVCYGVICCNEQVVTLSCMSPQRQVSIAWRALRVEAAVLWSMATPSVCEARQAIATLHSVSDTYDVLHRFCSTICIGPRLPSQWTCLAGSRLCAMGMLACHRAAHASCTSSRSSVVRHLTLLFPMSFFPCRLPEVEHAYFEWNVPFDGTMSNWCLCLGSVVPNAKRWCLRDVFSRERGWSSCI